MHFTTRLIGKWITLAVVLVGGTAVFLFPHINQALLEKEYRWKTIHTDASEYTVIVYSANNPIGFTFVLKRWCSNYSPESEEYSWDGNDHIATTIRPCTTRYYTPGQGLRRNAFDPIAQNIVPLHIKLMLTLRGFEGFGHRV